MKVFVPALVVALGFASVFQISSAFGAETITVTTDKADYAPMEVVTISGNNFDSLKVFTLQVVSSDEPPVDFSAPILTDADGHFVYKYQLDGTFRPNYTVYVKDNTNIIASTTFTDANPATDISQCQNGGIGDPLQPCNESTFPAASGYGYEGNANANGGNSHWYEGDFVPLRIVATNYVAGAGYIDFSIDVTKGGKHAYDYVGSFDATETTAASDATHANHNNPCGDIISGCVPTSPDGTGTIPAATLSPFPVACGSNTFAGSQVPGSIKTWGTSGAVTVSYVSENVGSSDCSTRIRVAWANTKASFGGKIVIAYAAHIAKQSDWGAGNSAINISGSPYHSSLVERSTGGDVKGIGNQDAKLAASAVIVPQNATLTLVKTVTNDNGGTALPTAWTLAASGPTPISGATGSAAVTSATVTQGTYNLSESGGPANYTGGTYSCVKNGGGAVVSNSITLAANDVATCTVNNNDNPPALHLRKTVTNDNGGTAVATDWTLTATGTGGSPTNLSGTTPVDSNASFKADTYALGETGPANYTGAWNCGAATMPDATHVTVPFGGNVTCTINNNDNAAHLIVIKHVVNNNGGSAVAGDFTTTISGVTTTTPTAAGVESPGVDNVLTTLGSYSVDEGAHAGYTKTLSADCSGTIALGQTKTCTITNDDQQAYITVNKVVTNDNGGTAQPNDFSLTLEGSAVSSGVQVPVNPGTYTAGETNLPGYTFEGFTGDCNASGDVTVALGESKSCTLTNNDQQAYITVVKVVTNDNGGSAQPNDFKLTLEGNAVNSGVQVPVNPGTYTAGETQLSGYTFSGFSGDCDNNGDVTVALGESKTCTLTNDDQQAFITVVKVVHNNYGGTALPNDFNLTLGGNATTSGTAVPVNPGTYTAGETLLAGYHFDGFSGACNSSGDVTVALGESKTCTLTNSDVQPKLTLIKHVTNDNGGNKVVSDFPLFVGATQVTSGAKNGFSAGAYTASETNLTGYAASGWSGDCAADGSITLHIGDDKTCEITNDDIAPKLTIVKVVVNDNGGNAVVSDFPLFVNGNSVTSGVSNTLSANVLYTATETNLPGYTPVSWTGDCAADGTITLAPGDDKTCTITNDDIAPTITLIKHVVNDNGGTAGGNDFGLTIGGTATNSGDTKSVAANTAIALNEAGLTGYSFVSITGDAKCPAVLGGTVTLDEGENITCTITNDDIAPQLTVIKHVINDNGGTAVAGNFTMLVSATNPSQTFFGGDEAGTTITLNAGTYSVGETGVSGYSASFSTDCSGSVALGETKTCTITNDDNAPVLHLRKVVVNNNGGTALATDWTLTADGADANDLTGTTPVDSGAGLAADTFALSETGGPSGYSASAWVCVGGQQNGSNITLGIGEEATCTITNDDIAPRLTVIKHVINDDGDIAVASDFTMLVTGTNVSSSSFAGSEAGVTVTLNAGSYGVDEANSNGYIKTLGLNCSGTIAVGETKVCTITNNDTPHATRTLGFWQTHTTYTSDIFAQFGGTLTIGSKNIDSTGKLFAGFYASISKDSNNNKRSQLDQARMQLLQQWLAAELNCKAFGCSLTTQNLLTAAASAFAGTNRNLILSYASQLDAYNNSNDALPIAGQGKATPQASQVQALLWLGFWNVLP